MDTNQNQLPDFLQKCFILKEISQFKIQNGPHSMLAMQLTTPDVVTFPRADNGDAVSLKQTFSAQCFSATHPEAFNALAKAPTGAKILVNGRFVSRSAIVRGKENRDITVRLGQMEITEAKVLQVLRDIED